MLLQYCRPRRPLAWLLIGLMVILLIVTMVSIDKRNNSVNLITEYQKDAASTSGWFNSMNLASGRDLWSPAVSTASITGGVIMSELGNATIRAELGQAAWRVLHTMASRFPKQPTEDEKEALRSFIYLFARLYPCGQCAKHFQIVLEEHPPVVTSRSEVAQWACRVHNVVNKRLEKPIFDCSKVESHWKCGCADADAEDSPTNK